MIFADFCSLRICELERQLIAARRKLVVVTLGNEDHRRQIRQLDRRDDRCEEGKRERIGRECQRKSSGRR